MRFSDLTDPHHSKSPLSFTAASVAHASSLSPPGAPDTPSPPITVLSDVRKTTPPGTNLGSGIESAILRSSQLASNKLANRVLVVVPSEEKCRICLPVSDGQRMNGRCVPSDHHLLDTGRINHRGRNRIAAPFTNANGLRCQFFRSRPALVWKPPAAWLGGCGDLSLSMRFGGLR
jgi:hypothetical protein